MVIHWNYLKCINYQVNLGFHVAAKMRYYPGILISYSSTAVLCTTDVSAMFMHLSIPYHFAMPPVRVYLKKIDDLIHLMIYEVFGAFDQLSMLILVIFNISTVQWQCDNLYVTASEQNIPVTSLDVFCPVSTLDRPVCSLDKNMSSEHTGINADAQWAHWALT